jgi:hypothetical protein
MTQRLARTKKTHILAPPAIEKKHVAAIQALHQGVANEGQQKEALDCIINLICGTYDEPYREDERDTLFALGKAHVGREIVTITKLPLGKMK